MSELLLQRYDSIRDSLAQALRDADGDPQVILNSEPWLTVMHDLVLNNIGIVAVHLVDVNEEPRQQDHIPKAWSK